MFQELVSDLLALDLLALLLSNEIGDGCTGRVLLAAWHFPSVQHTAMLEVKWEAYLMQNPSSDEITRMWRT